MGQNIINENKLINLIEQKVKRLIKESIEQKELSNKIAQEVLGTPSFEEFYKNTGFWVDPKDYALMQEYFRRLKEATQEIENKHKH